MFLKKQYGARNSSSQDRYRKVTLAKSSYERLRDSTVLLSARNALTNIHKKRIEQKQPCWHRLYGQAPLLRMQPEVSSVKDLILRMLISPRPRKLGNAAAEDKRRSAAYVQAEGSDIRALQDQIASKTHYRLGKRVRFGQNHRRQCTCRLSS